MAVKKGLPPIYNTEELLLNCARKDLSEDSKRKAIALIEEGVQWKRFPALAGRNGVTILIYDALMVITPYTHIPQFVLDRLKSDYLLIVAKTTSQHKKLLELLKLFSEKGISTVPLKGTILSKRLYGDIATRGLSVDFDLLIEEEDKEKAQALLEEAGYSSHYNNKEGWSGCNIFSKPGAKTIDLHWDIITLFGRSDEGIKELRKGIRKVEEEGIVYYEFKEEELLLYLSSHLVSSDFFGQLRYVCDINELLHRHKDVLDWDNLIEKAKKWRLSSSLYTTLKLCKELFNPDVSREVLKKLKPCFFNVLLIRIFANKKVVLRDKLRRKRLIGGLIEFIFFGLIEARSPKQYVSIFFPPREKIRNKNYFQRFFKGVSKAVSALFLKSR